MSRTVISTDKAPAAIGTYSQAIKTGSTVYLSGQIPLDPQTMELVEGFEAQAVQVFENLKAVAEAAGGSLKDVEVYNCVQQLAKKWTFPAPTGGKCAVFDAPYNFTPKP